MDRARLQKAESIFNELVGFSGKSLADELTRHCAGDEDLRSLVERLLKNDDSGMGRFLETPVFEPSGDPSTDDPSLLPQTIGGYTIVRCIGEGGMGVVYEAVQANPRRTVALKVLRSPLPSSAMLTRFRHEAQILARLRHPGIAHVYEAAVAQIPLPGGLQSSQPFFAMELVAGQPLRPFAESKRLDVRQRIELMIQVCEAVQHAHENGVIHRDLKSENILVEAAGRPRILDFGVARLVGAEDETLTLRTRAGEIVGTLAYMSPEQVGGDPTLVDTRSDVYSLGVILYDLLTGKLPHDVRGLSLAEAARRIQDDEPRSIAFHDSNLRGEVEWIVTKCIEKDRARRYQSAGELSRDLRHHLAGEPIDARRDSTAYVIGKMLRRRRGLVVSLSALALSLLLGVSGTVWQAVHASRERDEANEQALRATETANLLQRMIGFATPEMAKGTTPTVREMLDSASKHLIDNDATHPAVAADTHTVLSDAYNSLGEFKLSESHARSAFDLRIANKGPNDAHTLEAAGLLASAMSRLDRDDEAVRLCRDALDAARATLPLDSSTCIKLAINYAFVLENAPTHDQAEVIRWSREGYDRSVAKLGPDHADSLAAATDLGVTLMNADQLDEAESLFRRVLNARRQRLSPDHPDMFTSLNNLASVLDRRNNLTGAREVCTTILEQATRVLGPDHPRTCRYAQNLAMLCAQLGDLPSAETHARRALAAAARLGPAHQDVLSYRGLLASVLIEQGKLEDAEPLAKEQYEVCERELGMKHPGTIRSYTLQFDLAQARNNLIEMRRWAEALKGTQWETEVFKQLAEAEKAAPATP